MRRIAIGIALLFLIGFAPYKAMAQTAYVYPFFPSTTAPFQSFLRIVNPTITPINVTLNFLSYNAETSFASCTLAIPGDAAPQYSASQLEQCAGLEPPSSASVLSINLGSNGLFFQYLLWGSTSGYLAPGGSCAVQGAPPDFAADLYTSVIQGYPSELSLLISAGVNYQVDANIFDAKTGALIGTWQSSPQPLATKILAIPMSQVQSQATWTVTTIPPLVNMQLSVTPAGGGNAIPQSVTITGNWVTQNSPYQLFNLESMCKS